MDPQHLAGVYANFANITFSDYEFTLTFARIDHEVEEGDVPGVVVARVEHVAAVRPASCSRPCRTRTRSTRRSRASRTCPRPNVRRTDRNRRVQGTVPWTVRRVTCRRLRLPPPLRHRDALHQRRVVLEPQVVPERRARLFEARLLEAAGRGASPTAGRCVALSARQSASAS